MRRVVLLLALCAMAHPAFADDLPSASRAHLLYAAAPELDAEQIRLGRLKARTPVSSERTLLQWSDLSLDGCFRTIGLGSGSRNPGFFPMDMLQVGASRKYYMMGSRTGLAADDEQISEFDEPTVESCAQALADINAPATSVDMGEFPTTYASENLYAGQTNVFTTGLRYDDTTGRFYVMWGAAYPNGSGTLGFNSFAAATWNGSAFSLVGCWSLGSAWPQGVAQNGILHIPSWFTTAYLSAGQRLAVGLGGGRSGQSPQEASHGFFARAITSPTGNDCTTDNHIDTGATLANHLWSPSTNYSSGPTCSIPDNAATTTIYEADNLGCTTNAPYSLTGSTPQPARTSFASYSSIAAVNSWDPYGGEGFYGDEINAPGTAWFDNGTKHGLLSLINVPSGWMNTTVDASPAPTFSGTTYTFKPVSGLSVNNGHNVQIGSYMWVETCVRGVGACSTNNGNHVTIVRVTGVNTGTGVVTAEHYSPDGTGSGATPIVGGDVWFGSVYVHGIPVPSQSDYFRLQFRNPDHLAEVVLTARNAWNIPYAQDIALTDITQFGCPAASCASAITPDTSRDAESALNVFADNVNNKIILLFRYHEGGGTYRALGFRYSVN
jgi:hypothetical protein